MKRASRLRSDLRAGAAALDVDAAYADAAVCDVIRDEIDADEVARAMGVDADEVLS